MNLLAKGEAPWLLQLRRFFASPWCLAVQAALAALAVVFHAGTAGMLVLVALCMAQLVLCDDLLVPFAPALLACVIMIKSSENPAFAATDDALIKEFGALAWLVVLPAGAITAHIKVYKTPFVRGRAAWAILAVSIATTLGGLGAISAKEYFAGGALYHTGLLGFGMLLFYMWLSGAVATAVPNSTTGDSDSRLERFIPNLMLALGLLAAFMVFHQYLSNLPRLMQRPELLAFQWRNNASTFLMLALPFPFYKAFKQPLFLLTGLVMYLALLLSGSRGGMLFGTIELVMCVLFMLLADKKRRLIYLGIAALVLGAAAVCVPLLVPFFRPVITRFLGSVFNGEQEVRLQLYKRAVQDFLAHPVFGVGLGWVANRDLHPSKTFALCWYHNAPLQIIGSLGVVGAAAYIYQYIVRVKIFLRRPATRFRLTLFLAWVGLEMMSLVNPGVFAPVPYLMILTILIVVAEKTVETHGSASPVRK